MATYQITVNEKATLGKGVVAFLQSIPHVVTFDMPPKKEAKKSDMYHRLDSALADVRLMVEGKKRKKTLDELIDEIRNSND